MAVNGCGHSVWGSVGSIWEWTAPWSEPAARASGYPGSAERTAEILRGKPRHWLEWYEGRGQFNFEVPADLIPAAVRETEHDA